MRKLCWGEGCFDVLELAKENWEKLGGVGVNRENMGDWFVLIMSVFERVVLCWDELVPETLFSHFFDVCFCCVVVVACDCSLVDD